MGKLEIPSDQWPVLSRLLDEALDLPPGQRDRWLSDLPPVYAGVKPLLTRLLTRASQVLSSPLLEDLPSFDTLSDETQAQDLTAGEVIGPWRLIRLLGEGGMASVWLAERAAGTSGPVALKLPRPGLHASGVAERIARESEILATLHHPNIARLLDAGVLPGGHPYLALEYVDGLHIDDYCREHRLSLELRLRLVRQIAHTIAYAHSRLIVHRDLKPSNILVTPDGQVHIMDFGIAKILHDGATRETRLTRLSGMALTLDYASPEQVAGSPLTVASDIYSLGVVFYELLAGVRPYRIKRSSQAALEEAILEIEPRPPSELAAYRTLARALRGDLDTIVLKALKKDPGARYSSMDAFADDVRRYSLNLPVAAQPDRFPYRLSKFFRRHWLAAMAVSTIILIVVAGTTLIAWQARVAFTERRKAEDIKSFLVSSLLESHSYWSGHPLSALELLHHVASRFDRLKSADPATRVQLLNIIAAAMLSLQDTTGTESTTAAAVRESAALPRDHPQVLRARMLQDWVRLYRGQFLEARNDIDDLTASMRRTSAVLPEDFAGALRIRSKLALDEVDYNRAEASALEASRFAEQRLGPRHNQSVLALVDLSSAYRSAGKIALALETCDLARRRALEAYSGKWDHPNTIKARVACAQALADSGQYAHALEEASRAAHDSSQLFGPCSRFAGVHLAILARLQFLTGDLRAAHQNTNHAHAILEQQLEVQSLGYAEILELRGLVLLYRHDYSAAVRDFNSAENLTARSLGPGHIRTLVLRAHRALALAKAGRLPEARQILPTFTDSSQSHRVLIDLPRMEIALASALDYLSVGRPREAASVLSPVVRWCSHSPYRPPVCAEARAAGDGCCRREVSKEKGRGFIPPARLHHPVTGPWLLWLRYGAI